MTFDSQSSHLLLLFRWYLAAALLQVATLPVTLRVFRTLPDRGVSLSKALGLALAGFTAWWAWALGLLENRTADLWLSSALLGLLCWGVLAGTGRRFFTLCGRLPLAPILACEGVFLAGFLLMSGVRAWAPGVGHTEQPMDMMVFTSLWNSPEYPPQDAWLSGYPLSYYYLGYWFQLVLGRLSGVGPDAGYNLGLATLLGLLLAGLFGLGFNLTRASPSASRSRPVMAYAGGLLAVALTAFAGNLRTLYDLAVHSSGLPNWWWLSSRAIRDFYPNGTAVSAITEFPSFSYLLGDNHPHLQSSPLLLTVAGLVLARIIASREDFRTPESRWTPLGIGRSLLSLVLPAFLVAAVAATNSWDAPLALGLFLAGAWVSSQGKLRARLQRSLGEILGASALALCLALPYLATARGRVFGFLPNHFGPSELFQFLSAMGPAFFAACALILVLYRRRLGWRALHWGAGVGFAATAGTALLVLATGQYSPAAGASGRAPAGTDLVDRWPALQSWVTQPWVVLALLTMLGLLLSRGIATRATPNSGGLQGSLVLAFAGLGALLAPEFVYVVDTFQSRTNTIFKCHYGAWVLLGPAAAYAIIRLARAGRHRLLLAALGLLSGAALLYPILAFRPITAAGRLPECSLAASADLRLNDPALLEVLLWIDRNAPPGAVVVESPGTASEPQSNPISTFTGRPTLLGWLDHERQWRRSEEDPRLEERLTAVETLYLTNSRRALTETARRFSVRFVVLGPRERERYGTAAGTGALEQAGRLVFSNESFKVLDLEGPAAGDMP